MHPSPPLTRFPEAPALSPTAPMEELAREIADLDRNRCIDELQRFRTLPLDFDRSFLERMSTEKLRHTLLAACITSLRKGLGPRA